MEEKVLRLDGTIAYFIIEQTSTTAGWALGYRGIPIIFRGGMWMEIE